MEMKNTIIAITDEDLNAVINKLKQGGIGCAYCTDKRPCFFRIEEGSKNVNGYLKDSMDFYKSGFGTLTVIKAADFLLNPRLVPLWDDGQKQWPEKFVLICRTRDESDKAASLVGQWHCPSNDPICHLIKNGKHDNLEYQYKYLSEIGDWKDTIKVEASDYFGLKSKPDKISDVAKKQKPRKNVNNVDCSTCKNEDTSECDLCPISRDSESTCCCSTSPMPPCGYCENLRYEEKTITETTIQKGNTTMLYQVAITKSAIQRAGQGYEDGSVLLEPVNVEAPSKEVAIAKAAQGIPTPLVELDRLKIIVKTFGD
jgi:hypothetical protein